MPKLFIIKYRIANRIGVLRRYISAETTEKALRKFRRIGNMYLAQVVQICEE